MPTQPQDHRPAKNEPFRFTDSKGKAHTLPLASVGRSKLPGRDLRDAVLSEDGTGGLAYMFKALEAAGPDKAALDALYDMPQDDMSAVLNEWAEHGDGDGASLGESTPSTT